MRAKIAITHPIYIVILCIISIVCTSLFAVRVDAAEQSDARVQVLHITPDYLEGNEVYPTRHAIVGLDPMETYTWEYIEFPDEWLGDEYYFELWGADNRPLPGFAATKLHEHMNSVVGNRIPLQSLDATLYPAVRLVLFPQEGAQPIAARTQAVHAYYTQQPNDRFGVFVVMLAVLLVAFVCGVVRWRVPILRTLMGSLPLVRGEHATSDDKTIYRLLQFVLLAGVWSSVFGATLGLHVGGIQIVYLLIKLPFLLLVSFLFSFLSSSVLSLLLGIRASMRDLLIQSLRVLATFALSLASLCSLIIFYIIADYTHDQLLTAFMFAVSVAGLLATLQLWNWIRQRAPGLRGVAVAAVWLGLYGVVLLQFGWMLRPWVGATDPIHGTVPFARLDSGSVFEEVFHTIDRL